MTCHAQEGEVNTSKLETFSAWHVIFAISVSKQAIYFIFFNVSWLKSIFIELTKNKLKLNYQTFLFTASYVALHNSTKNCTFLVMRTHFVLQWNYSRCAVVVIEAHYSHTGILTLWESGFFPMKPIAVEAFQYKEGSKGSCYFLNLDVNELCALIR